MYCPKCKSEFRDGYVHCQSCNENLVDNLPVDGKKDHSAKQCFLQKEYPSIIYLILGIIMALSMFFVFIFGEYRLAVIGLLIIITGLVGINEARGVFQKGFGLLVLAGVLLIIEFPQDGNGFETAVVKIEFVFAIITLWVLISALFGRRRFTMIIIYNILPVAALDFLLAKGGMLLAAVTNLFILLFILFPFNFKACKKQNDKSFSVYMFAILLAMLVGEWVTTLTGAPGDAFSESFNGPVRSFFWKLILTVVLGVGMMIQSFLLRKEIDCQKITPKETAPLPGILLLGPSRNGVESPRERK